MKLLLVVLGIAFLLAGCASPDRALISQLLDDINAQKAQNQQIVNQANQAIQQCQSAKIEPQKKPKTK